MVAKNWERSGREGLGRRPFGLALLASLALLGGTRCRADAPVLSENDKVLQAWSQQNPGSPVPELQRQEDGGTRLEWRGNLTVDTYTNQISSASGTVTSALQAGTFGKAVMQGDLRAISTDGSIVNAQLGLTASNDRSVLSRYPRQINNLQFGASGPGYLFAVGDVSPNFSSLGSALGLRGLMGQRQFGDTTISAYGGVVAESWEALQNWVPRNQFLREVYGIKIERRLLPSLTIFATAQQATDRADSLSGPSYATPVAIRSSSLGFEYQEGSFRLTGETANGGSQAEGQAGHRDRAYILDASFQLGRASMRAGHHDLPAGFATLSGMAQPGVAESYLAGDLQAAAWISLGGEIRRSRMRTLATEWTPATSSRTDSASLRANINLGPQLPGWGVNLQQTASTQRDPQDQISRNSQSSMSLAFSSPKVSVSMGHGMNLASNEAYPESNSKTSSWQFSLARNYSNADAQSQASWSMGTHFSGSLQRQETASGLVTSNTNYSFGFSGQRSGWGAMQLSASDGLMTQANGAPGLRQRNIQLDANRPLDQKTSVKLYVRDSQRNIGDAVMESHESVSGVQLSAQF